MSEDSNLPSAIRDSDAVDDNSTVGPLSGRSSSGTGEIRDEPSGIITKTCPCNVYPLEPHFYIAKLGFAGVYLFFLFLLQNIDCGYSLEPPRRGGSNMYQQSMF